MIYFYILNRTSSWTWILQSKSILHQQKAMCPSLHNLQISKRNRHHSKLHFLIIALEYFIENEEGKSIVLDTFLFRAILEDTDHQYLCAWRRNRRFDYSIGLTQRKRCM